MLEYYLSKGITIFKKNTINLEKLPNEVKDRINGENI